MVKTLQSTVLTVLFLIASFSTVLMGTEGTEEDISPLDVNAPDIEETMDKVRDNNGFIENKGQIGSEDIIYYSNNGNVFFTPTGVMYRFREMEPIEEEENDNEPFRDRFREQPRSYHERGVVLKYTFIGANVVIPVGIERCSWNTNYFKGNDPEKWYTEVPSFREVIYPEIWDGIDMVYRQNDEGIKYDIIVHPGADPENIRIRIDGANRLSINQKGDLVIGTGYWDIIDSGLYTYYQDGLGGSIQCQFELINEYEYSFSLGSYDTNRIMVIDPSLAYSTFIGGSGHDYGEAIAIDSSRNSYITGFTYDDSTDYPTITGAYDTTHNGSIDLFVTKLSSTGSSLMYSTFIGGHNNEYGYGIAIDSSGDAFITGGTYSSDYPTTFGAYDTSNSGNFDVFVTKLRSTGSSLTYSTFIGVSSAQQGFGIAIDSSGNAFVTGFTSSADYPTTSGAYDTSYNGGEDVFMTKLSSTGSSLMYSTFLGGSGTDEGYGIAVDSIGNAYIAGRTDSFNYPTTSGAYDTSHNGNKDVFVSKLNSTGYSLTYSTFIGGSTDDESFAMSIDSSGNVYVTGETLSTDYPTTSGASDTSHNGSDDVFVTKLNSAGSSLAYSTFIGGSDGETGYAIDVDSSGQAYVTGIVKSSEYPTTSGAYDITYNGNNDVFLTKINSAGSSLSYSTFIGGPSDEHGDGIAVDPSGNAFTTGWTASPDYPTTLRAYDTVYNGNYDLFVTNIKFTTVPTKPLNLNGTVGNGFIQLRWEPPLDNGGPNISNYTIYKGETSTAFSKLVKLENVTFYNDTAIINGQTYYYYIVANNSIDESYPSDILKVWDNKPPVILEDLTSPIATTGDEFNITVNVVDNVLVEKVVMVMDDMHDIVTTFHKDFKSNGLCTFKYTAPTRIVEEVMYSISAIDLSGNTAGIGGSFKVIDNDPPELIADKTNYPITTGDEVNFSFDIKDNMWVEWANLTIRYSNDTIREIELVKGQGINWYNSTVFGKSDEFDNLYAIIFGGPPLNMTLSMGDAFGNWRTVRLPERRMVDNDPPLLLEDLTDKSASTGENFTFRFKALDNIDLDRAQVEYWYMNGTRFRASTPRPLMGGVWETTIKVPVSPPFTDIVYWNRTKIECNLTYSFHIWDPSGNEFVSNETQIEILDTIPPELVSHEYIPGTGPTTGDPFEIRVRLKDNIQVRYASILFKFFHDLEHSTSEYRAWMNRSTTEEGLFSFSFAEISDSEFRFFQYRIEVWDAKARADGIPHYFNFPRLNIIDNDPPTIESYFSQRNTTTGGKLNVWVSVRDNWKVSDVRMEVWSTGEVKEYVLTDYDTISDSDELNHSYLYERVLDIPIDSVEPLHIIFKVTDQSNNTASTTELTIEVIDNIVPSLQPISNITIKKGENLQIAAEATDNIGIDQVHWEGSPITASGLTLEGIINQAGTFIITVTVLDKAGNSNTTSFYLTVEGPEDGKDSTNLVIMIIVALVLLAVIAITIYRVWRSDREPFEKPDIGSESPEPPELGEAPEEPALPPAPEKEVVVVTVPASTPAPAQAYVPSDQIPAAPMPVQGTTESYISPLKKEPRPLIGRPDETIPSVLGKEPVEELGPQTQELLKP